jgi:predicted Zn-dependent protease with MMP-like domain
MTRPPLDRRKTLLRPRTTPRPSQPCPHIDPSRKLRQATATREEFTRLVARALDTLPEEIIEKLENVAVTIEEQPSPEVLEEMGLTTPDDLFGLYRGVPRPWRSIFAPLSEFPDKIEIYYKPIIHACTRPHEIRDLVRRVVVHEVGHHFGMSDQQLRALGY